MAKQRNSRAVRVNIWMLKLSRHWLHVVLVILGIYISLPWVAPTLMKIGLTGPADVIYTLYSPFCHQFAFRSFFLYGEQPVYPRTVSDTDWTPYEEYIQDVPEFENIVDPVNTFTVDYQLTSRFFKGNNQMGYKTTLCERDIMIYTMLFVGGLIYSRLRWRLRPVPIWLYIILGLGPIGIDGFSQLLSYPPFEFWAVRETEPAFRVLTGALFGLMNAWLVFPYLERSMQETRAQLETKLRQAGIDV